MVVPSIESGGGVVGSGSAPNGSSVNATVFLFPFLRQGSKSGSSDTEMGCFEVGWIDVGRVGCKSMASTALRPLKTMSKACR